MFQVFRRHQKRWLTAVTIFAMIGFAFPLGSTYFGGSARRQHRGQEVVETIFGTKVTSEDIGRARLERVIANTFAQLMIATLHPEVAHLIAQREPFGPSRDEEAIKDSIRMTRKADTLGIRVTDDMIRTWISRNTDGKLTTEQFMQVVNKVGRQTGGEGGISPEAIFDILRNQLRIEQVVSLALGRFGDGPSPVTPYEAWQFYRRLNDKLGLEVIAVPVANFVGQIDDPGDEALRELYNKYIARLPDPASPEPGFKEPRRMNLQYASVSLNDFTLAMLPELTVGDEEIEQYYESHKELYRIRPSVQPAAAPADAPEKPAPDSIEPRDEKKEDPGPPKDPDSNPQGLGEKNQPQPANNSQDEPAQEPRKQQTADENRQAQESTGDSKEIDKPDQDDPKQENDKGKVEKKDETPQYKSLDDVASEIRDILVKDKARAELLKRLAQVDRAVNEFMKVYLAAKDKFDEQNQDNLRLEFEPPQAPDFSKIAENLGLKLSETGLTALDDEEFRHRSIGQGIELEDGRARGRTIAAVMGSTEFYESRQFQNFLNDEFFVAWKIDDKPEHEPSFAQIRDNVLLVFRTIKARELAHDRASKLAASLRELDGDIDKLRENETGLELITIAPTALWSNAPMFRMQMMSRPSRMPADLPGLRLPSDELRNKTFELKEREVTVAPNQPQDIYYVVLLSKRESASREDFVRSQQIIERQIQSEQSEKMYREWLVDLRRESSGQKSIVPVGN